MIYSDGQNIYKTKYFATATAKQMFLQIIYFYLFVKKLFYKYKKNYDQKFIDHIENNVIKM